MCVANRQIPEHPQRISSFGFGKKGIAGDAECGNQSCEDWPPLGGDPIVVPVKDWARGLAFCG
jgi:hypothetical protein